MADFRQLKVWKKAHEVTLDVYRLAQQFPKSELDGLTSQCGGCDSDRFQILQEGRGRDGDAEFRRLI